jgi:hydroxyacylglutathione hydrolase
VKIQSVTVGPFQENCYLVIDEKSQRAALIDPGAEPNRIADLVRASGASLDAIWITHAHIDHIGGIAGIKRMWDVPVHLHPLDGPLYVKGFAQAAYYGIPFEQPAPAEREIAEGDVLRIGALAFHALHTPGHAPGHVAFRGHGVVFGGDLLFAGSIGRTDLPLSDPDAMEKSLERLCALDDGDEVYPGHGPRTSIGVERSTNPFLTGTARVVKR